MSKYSPEVRQLFADKLKSQWKAGKMPKWCGIPDNGMIGMIRTPLPDAAFEKLKQAQLEAASQAGRPRLHYLRAHPEEVVRLLERTRWTMYTDTVKRL